MRRRDYRFPYVSCHNRSVIWTEWVVKRGRAVYFVPGVLAQSVCGRSGWPHLGRVVGAVEPTE